MGDNERAVCSSNCLNVKGYPTIVGVNSGEIVAMHTGVPSSESEFKSLIMKIVNPTQDQKQEHSELSLKFQNLAGMAALSFSQRESIERNTQHALDCFEKECHNLTVALQDVKFLEQILSNVLLHPQQTKYRSLKL